MIMAGVTTLTLARPSEAQVPLPIITYVDNQIGSDVTGDGTSGNPFRTLTHALSIHVGLTPPNTVVIRAAAKNPYSSANGESFPLHMIPGITIERDLTASTPGQELLVTGAPNGVGAREDCLFEFIADNGQVFDSSSGLKNMRLEETKGLEGAVYVFADSLSGLAASASPTFENLTFNQCNVGIHVKAGTHTYNAVPDARPSLTDCTFTIEPNYYASGVQTVSRHVLFASDDQQTGLVAGHGTVGGTISTCTFKTNGVYSMDTGLEFRTTGGFVETVVDSCLIHGQTTQASSNGIAKGIQLYYFKPANNISAANNVQILNSKIRNCGTVGIELFGKKATGTTTGAYGSASSNARISRCTIIKNGFHASSNAWEGHGVSVHVENRSGFEVVIEDNTNGDPLSGPFQPGDARIAENARSGVFLHPDGDGTGGLEINSRPTKGTFVGAKIRRNRIHDNGQDGIEINDLNGSSTVTAYQNEVFDNSRTGVRQYTRNNSGYLSASDYGVGDLVLWNNAIFDLQGNATGQAYGVYNYRYDLSGPSFTSIAQMTSLFNTIAYNTQYGIRNRDSHGQDNCSSVGFNTFCTQVFGTIAYQNGGGLRNIKNDDFNQPPPVGSRGLVTYSLFDGSYVAAKYSTTPLAVVFQNGAAGDFHLSASSNAIDWAPDAPVGVPPFPTIGIDFDGESRPFDIAAASNVYGTNDIGFDEAR